MTLENDLTELIQQINPEWFEKTKKEFENSEGYDKKTNSIQKTASLIPESESLNSGDDFRPVQNHKEISSWTLTSNFNTYIWITKTQLIQENKRINLSILVNQLIKRIEKTLELTGSLQEKHLILLKAMEIVKRESNALKSNNNPEYNKYLNAFFSGFRISLIKKFIDIFWFIKTIQEAPANHVNDQNKESTPVKRQIPLSLEFFKILFTLTDEKRSPIIKHEDFINSDSYAQYFYSISRGQSPKDKSIKIDFNWNMEPIYYLIKKIKDHSRILTLDQIEKLNTFTIKGTPFNSRACSKGASKFANDPKHFELKESIDLAFA